MKCTQCGETVPIWRRGLLTGICPICQKAPSPLIMKRLNKTGLIARKFAILSVFIALFLFVPWIPVPVLHNPFSSQDWIQGDLTVRGRMAEDCVRVATKHLHGKHLEDVLALLGPPDIDQDQGVVIRYRVDYGSRSFIHFYPNDLVIRFGKGNEVVDISFQPQEKKRGALVNQMAMDTPHRSPGSVSSP